MYRKALWCGAAALVAGVGSCAHAADAAGGSGAKPPEVATVIVTAEKRAENLQDVPLSVSAVSGETLQRQNVTNLQDMTRLVPSVAVYPANNARNTSVEIRNIGSSGTNPGIEPSVGVFIDGVYMSAGGVALDELADISSVEILRGPQGTLYGRNTAVGAINIVTRAPSQTVEGMVDVQGGNYGQRRVAAYVGGGLTDDLAGRISVFTSGADGTEKNLFNGGARADDTSQYGTRGRLRWTPNEAATIDAIGYYTEIRSHCCIPVPLDPYGVGGVATPGFLSAFQATTGTAYVTPSFDQREVNANRIPDDKTDVWGGSLHADYKLPRGVTLTSITGFNRFNDNIVDQNGWGLPLAVAHPAQHLIEDEYSEELRATSPSDGRIEYIAGLFAFYQDTGFSSTVTLLQGANRVFPGALQVRPGDESLFFFKQKTYSAAAFGQVKLNVTHRLHLIGGLRFNADRKTGSILSYDAPNSSAKWVQINAPSSVPSLKRSSTKTTWLLTAQYEPTDESMLYASAGTGYKDGGFNARPANNLFPFVFGPENSTSYEVGLKSSWLDRRLQLNIDAYRLELKGFQQSIYDSSITPPTFIVGNAGNLRNEGLEAELTARPMEPLTVNGDISYSRSTYTSFPAGSCPNYPGPILQTRVGAACDYTGLTPAGSPKVTWNLNAEWTQPFEGRADLEWFVAGGLTYTSSQYLDGALDPRSFQKAVALLDGRLGLENRASGWRLSVFGKNLTDEVYLNAAANLAQAPFISGGGTSPAQGFVGWYAPPRTVGVELNKTF